LLFHGAGGSAFETQNHLIYGREVGYFEKNILERLVSSYNERSLQNWLMSFRSAGGGETRAPLAQIFFPLVIPNPERSEWWGIFYHFRISHFDRNDNEHFSEVSISYAM